MLPASVKTVLAASLLAALPLPASAQGGPNLVLTTSVGFVRGGRLWALDRQYLPVTADWTDSVSLGRRFGTGFVATVGSTFFPASHLGYTLEVGFVGATTVSQCAPLGNWSFDSSHLNEQACSSIQGKIVRASAAVFQAGVTARLNPARAVQPYVRVGAGVAVLAGSFVNAEGAVLVPSGDTTTGPTASTWVLLEDPSAGGEITWAGTIAAGVTFAAGAGYQLRIEARDAVMIVPVVTGPAQTLGVHRYPATGRSTEHLFGLTVGLDLVLERRRPRRY